MPYLVVKTAANANKSYTLTNTCNKPRLAVRLSNGNTSYVALSQVNTTGVKVRGSNGVTYALVDKKNTYSYTIDRSTTVQSTTKTYSNKITYTRRIYHTLRVLAKKNNSTSTYSSTSNRMYCYDSLSRESFDSLSMHIKINDYLDSISHTINFENGIFYTAPDSAVENVTSSKVIKTYSFYSYISVMSIPKFYYNNETYTISNTDSQYASGYKYIIFSASTSSQPVRTSRRATGNTTYTSRSYGTTRTYSCSLSTTDSYYSLNATSRLNFTSSTIYTPGSNETIISSLLG